MLVFDVAPPRQYVGSQAYTKDWQNFFAAFPGPIWVERTDLNMTVGERVGFSTLFDPVSLTDKDGKKLELVSRITHGYRKVNGKWLIAHEHVSVPVDLATGKADLQSMP